MIPRKTSWIAVIPMTLVGLACSLITPKATPGTGSTPVETPTTQIDVSITTPPLTAIIPDALASNASTRVTTEVEFPYINPSVGDMPTHTKYLLVDYLQAVSIHLPQVLVFNAAEYAQYSELTAGIISALQSFDPAQAADLPDELSIGVINAQIQPIDFQNGSALRYLTQSSQVPEPVSNNGLFYYFQGLTDDGKYYVTAILPTSVPFLAATNDPSSPLPVDGIPFDFNNFETMPQYMEAVSQKLDATSADAFTPSLNVLDLFVQSFLIQS